MLINNPGRSLFNTAGRNTTINRYQIFSFTFDVDTFPETLQNPYPRVYYQLLREFHFGELFPKIMLQSIGRKIFSLEHPSIFVMLRKIRAFSSLAGLEIMRSSLSHQHINDSRLTMVMVPDSNDQCI